MRPTAEPAPATTPDASRRVPSARFQLRPRRRLRQRRGDRAAGQFGQHRLRRARGRCGDDARNRRAVPARTASRSARIRRSRTASTSAGARSQLAPDDMRALVPRQVARCCASRLREPARACTTSSRTARCTTWPRATRRSPMRSRRGPRDVDPAPDPVRPRPARELTARRRSDRTARRARGVRRSRATKPTAGWRRAARRAR